MSEREKERKRDNVQAIGCLIVWLFEYQSVEMEIVFSAAALVQHWPRTQAKCPNINFTVKSLCISIQVVGTFI